MKYFLKLITRHIIVIWIVVLIYNIFANTLFWREYEIVPFTYKDVTMTVTCYNNDTVKVETAYFKYKDNKGNIYTHDPNKLLSHMNFCDDNGCGGHDIPNSAFVKKYTNTQIINNNIYRYKPIAVKNILLVFYTLFAIIIFVGICSESDEDGCEYICPIFELCCNRCNNLRDNLRDKLVFLGYKIDDINEYITILDKKYGSYSYTNDRSDYTIKTFVEWLKNKNKNDENN